MPSAKKYCIFFGMIKKIKYQGVSATPEEIKFINELIKNNPSDSRWKLSKKLCKEWNWIQPNGALRDMFCRGFMLALHRAGYINLPEKKCNPKNPFITRKKKPKIEIDKTEITTNLKEILPLKFELTKKRSISDKTFNSLISEYHYLGYVYPIGRKS